MEEAKKVIVEFPLTLIVSAFVAMATAIVAMAIYFVASKKSDKRDAKENFTLLTNILLKNSESNMAQANANKALSDSIDKSKENHDRIANETQKLFMSLTQHITELKNGYR